MAFAEVDSIYNPIKSKIFSVECGFHLLARLEGRPVGLVYCATIWMRIPP